MIQYTVELEFALPEVSRMKKANLDYSNKAKQNKKHKLGEPYVHTFGALVVSLCQRDLGRQPQAQLLQTAKTEIAKAETGRKWIQVHVNKCRGMGACAPVHGHRCTGV